MEHSTDNLIVERKTIVTNAEPLKIKATPFADGHRVEFTLNLDPNNPIHLDQLMADLETSTVKQAIKAVHDMIVAPLEQGGLSSHVIVDADVQAKAKAKREKEQKVKK